MTTWFDRGCGAVLMAAAILLLAVAYTVVTK